MPHAPDPEEDDLEFDEEETAAEDELRLEGDEDADDWFADGDDLGAGDNGDDDDVDGAEFSDDDADDFFGDEDEDAEEDAASPPPTEATTALLARIGAVIAENSLFDPATDTILVAVSGGKDSVVLLDALHRLGGRVAVAHAHFGLRGEDADADAEFVRKLAKQYKVPFHQEHFATAAFAEKEKLSIQMAARTLRYAWFARLCADHGYAAVATGHHAADAAETVLLNLTRGTGLAGLHGIPARTPLPGGAASVVRPLLSASTAELYDYLVERQLTWREDASNEDTTHYRRNRLRHDVLPVLRELNPNLDQTLALSAERVRQAEALVAERVAGIAAVALTVEPTVTKLSVAALQNTPATALLLGELLRPYGFDYALARTVAGALSKITGGGSGTRFETATHRLVLDRGQLVITPKDLRPFGSFELTEDAAELKLPGGRVVRTQRVPADGYVIPRKPNTAALDAAKLSFPLVLRAWAPGDWLIPLGMRGKQKVSDLLVNLKVPANLKDRVLVLVNGNGSLVWVVGHRPDDRFKVTDATEVVVEVTVA